MPPQTRLRRRCRAASGLRRAGGRQLEAPAGMHEAIWSKYSCKLLQEAHVARVEQSNVADAVLHHGNAIDAHAEGEAADFAGVVNGVAAQLNAALVYRLKHRRVDHAAAQQLDPA